MRGFSKVVLAGNLTRDPELRALPSGTQVCSFTIAVNRSFKGSDGNMQEQTSFLDCSAWGRPGETISQYMHKGSPILVSGRLEQRSWDDKTTGQKRSRVEIVVDDFTFVGGGDAGGGNFGGGGFGGGASRGAAPAKPAAQASKSGGDFSGDDFSEDEPINLDEIPF